MGHTIIKPTPALSSDKNKRRMGQKFTGDKFKRRKDKRIPK